MIKDIVVHLTGSEEDKVRLAYAEPIARQFDAHLTGLYVHMIPEAFSFDPSGATYVGELMAESSKRAEETAAKLAEQVQRLGLSSELRRVDTLPASAGRALSAETRTADLFLGTRPYGDPAGQSHIEEAVLFGSGRGCVLVPPGGQPPRGYNSVLVAWKETREAARAVAEALPFLARAQQVVVTLVEEHGASEQQRIETGADIGRYLSRHGVSAEIRKLSGWDNTGEALLNEARATGADMIVMGGYGHSRFREWVLGGVSRYVMSNAAVPVLVAH